MLNETETQVKFKITQFNENKLLNSLTFISTIAEKRKDGGLLDSAFSPVKRVDFGLNN